VSPFPPHHDHKVTKHCQNCASLREKNLLFCVPSKWYSSKYAISLMSSQSTCNLKKQSLLASCLFERYPTSSSRSAMTFARQGEQRSSFLLVIVLTVTDYPANYCRSVPIDQSRPSSHQSKRRLGIGNIMDRRPLRFLMGPHMHNSCNTIGLSPHTSPANTMQSYVGVHYASSTLSGLQSSPSVGNATIPKLNTKILARWLGRAV
jgi:hypothetical protein